MMNPPQSPARRPALFGLVMIVVVLFIIVGDWLVSTREYRSDERDQRTREMDLKPNPGNQWTATSK